MKTTAKCTSYKEIIQNEIYMKQKIVIEELL